MVVGMVGDHLKFRLTRHWLRMDVQGFDDW